MSALSDLENLQLHDIADEDVRDDPRWQALMGEAGVKAFLAEMAAKHLGEDAGVKRHYVRDDEGQFAETPGGGGVDVIPGDKLKLAGRIPLGDGESLVGSNVFATKDSGIVPMALTQGPDGRRLRLGSGILHEDKRNWAGRNLGSTVVLDENGMRRFRAALDEMPVRGVEGGKRFRALQEREVELDQHRRDVVKRQYPNLSKAQAKRLDEVNRRTDEVGAEIARREERLRDTADYLARKRPADRQRWDEIEAEIATLHPQHQEDRIDRLRDEQARFSDSPSMRDNMRLIPQLREEREDLLAEQRELTANPVPLSPADQADLDRADADIAENDAKLKQIEESVVYGGVIPGEWADLVYGVSTHETTYEYDNMGIEYRIAVRPKNADADWYPSEDNGATDLDPKELAKLAKMLDDLTGDQPKSAHRPDMQGKHLPGRHNQQDHAGDGVPDFPLDQLDKRTASDITNWYGGLNATSWGKLSPSAQKSAVELADSESIDNGNHHPAEVLNALQLGIPHVGLRLAKHLPPEVMFERSTAAVNGWYGKLTERDYRGLGDSWATVSAVAKRQASKGNPLPQQKLDALRAQVKADPGKGLVGRTPAVDAALAKVEPAAQIGTPSRDVKPSDFNWMQPKRAEQVQDQLNQDAAWTRAQRTALSSYTDKTYRQINGGLRNPEELGDEHDKVRYLERAADIQAAMRPWPEHTIVHRGTSPNQFGLDLDPQDYEQLEQIVGREFVDDGFTSTSIERSESFDYPVKVEIRVPAGTPAAYVAKASQVTTENELLLAAGTRYRVLSADVIDLDDVDEGEYDERPYSRYAEIVMQVIP